MATPESPAGAGVPERPSNDGRRKPAWLPTMATIAAIVVFVLAGNWQHRRMLQKEALRAQIEAAAAAAPVPLPAGIADWRDWRFRHVVVTGTFDADHQILIDNEVRAGRAGYDVVTPMKLADDRIVLVDRGWVAMGPTRAIPPSAPPPAGVVSLRGRVDIPARHYFELGDGDVPEGPVWEHLDPQRFGAATGLPVLPIVVEAVEGPGGEGLARDWPRPDFGIEMHQGYMLQWYTFAAMAAGLWFWFALRPWLRARSR
ncbi:MAG TPA: SURF1 family protein [Casimicrobiaceae bacterium]|nr:SURF1 family protein [Casimicrobiaceae bacterium]